jgi:hypothetical protein
LLNKRSETNLEKVNK